MSKWGLTVGVLATTGLAVLVLQGFRGAPMPAGWTTVRPPYNTTALAVQGGIVWVGGEDGVVAIDRKTAAPRRPSDGQPSLRGVRDLLVTRRGDLWIAHATGVTRYADDQWRTFGPSSTFPSGPCFALCEDRAGSLWIGRQGGLIRRRSGEFEIISSREGLPLADVETIFEDRAGDIWVGSASPVHGGLARFDGRAWRTHSTRDGLVHNSVNQITQDREGAVWIATGFASRGGANRVANGRWTSVTRRDGLAGEKVRSIFEDSSGRLWFGSEYDGVAVRSATQWAVFTPRNGLAGWEVRDITQDSDGAVWLATENGVTRIARTAAVSARTPSGGTARSVAVYTSVDQVYSEPILQRFEQATGIRVLPVYDVEAAKTTGLVNRLIAEKGRPLADVFWSGEFVQTMLLEEQGVLAAYRPPTAADVPAAYRDPHDRWVGIAGRARVLLVNTKLLPPSKHPRSLFDLLNRTYAADRVGIALPLFGTSATHAAALYAALDRSNARRFFDGLRTRGVRIVDGNSTIRDMVADGRLLFGVTDTDDACAAVKAGAPVRVVVPDQEAGGLGALVIPGTVSLVAGAPHSSEASALIDYLVTKDVEAALVDAGWSHVPTRLSSRRGGCVAMTDLRRMNVTADAVFAQLRRMKQELTQVFVR